jgi:hypothetical protein
MGRVLDAGVDKGGVEGKLPTVTWNRNARENQQMPVGNCLHRQNLPAPAEFGQQKSRIEKIRLSLIGVAD